MFDMVVVCVWKQMLFLISGIVAYINRGIGENGFLLCFLSSRETLLDSFVLLYCNNSYAHILGRGYGH